MPRKKQPNKKSSYEDLGKMLVSIYETGYIDRNQTYKMSFMKGLISGLGGAIGATLLVALLIWTLSIFDSVPLIGRFFDNVRSTVETQTRKPME